MNIVWETDRALKKRCKECNTSLAYSEKYDSYACLKCNIWTESNCPDTNCEFCKNRPENPKKD